MAVVRKVTLTTRRSNRSAARCPCLALTNGGVDTAACSLSLDSLTILLAGLLPIMWTHGTGASVMQRIAAPMIGGMVTSTVLTLVVIPVLYHWWRRSQVSESNDPHTGPA